MKNPFKKLHRHNLDYLCHCYQPMCSCGKHLWTIVRDSKQMLNTDGKLVAFLLNGKDWIDIEALKEELTKGHAGYKVRFEI